MHQVDEPFTIDDHHNDVWKETRGSRPPAGIESKECLKQGFRFRSERSVVFAGDNAAVSFRVHVIRKSYGHAPGAALGGCPTISGDDQRRLQACRLCGATLNQTEQNVVDRGRITSLPRCRCRRNDSSEKSLLTAVKRKRNECIVASRLCGVATPHQMWEGRVMHATHTRYTCSIQGEACSFRLEGAGPSIDAGSKGQRSPMDDRVRRRQPIGMRGRVGEVSLALLDDITEGSPLATCQGVPTKVPILSLICWQKLRLTRASKTVSTSSREVFPKTRASSLNFLAK